MTIDKHLSYKSTWDVRQVNASTQRH